MYEHEIKSAEDRARALLAKARGMLNAAERDGRELTPDEDREVKSYVQEAEGQTARLKQLRKAAKESGAIRRKTAEPTNGWKAVAEKLVKSSPGTKVEAKLSDLIGKAPLTPPTTQLGIERRDGIAPLQEDLRRMYEAMPSRQLPAGTLHIEHLEVASHGVASGSVERSDPTSTAAKAEIDVDVNYETLDVKQFAATVKDIPDQLLESAPALMNLLQSAVRIELEKALDNHVFRTLDDDAGVQIVSGGSTFQEKLRKAKTDLVKNGASPDIALVSDADMETMDLLSEQSASLPREYPYGLRLIPSPLLQAGEFFVLDSSGFKLHLGSVSFLSDPYSGMDTNKVRLRLEMNALFEVIEPKKAIASAGSVVT